MGGWIRVALLAAFVAGTGLGGAIAGAKFVEALWTGQVLYKAKGEAARIVFSSVEPGRFWFQVTVAGVTSVLLAGLFATFVGVVLRAKRATGRSWAEYLAGIARTPRTSPTSRAGDIVAWILFVPILLLMMAFVAWLVSMR